MLNYKHLIQLCFHTSLCDEFILTIPSPFSKRAVISSQRKHELLLLSAIFRGGSKRGSLKPVLEGSVFTGRAAFCIPSLVAHRLFFISSWLEECIERCVFLDMFF